MEKLREIATLKLIGAPDRTIIGLIVQQALLMGVVGFVAGTALVSAMKDQRHSPAADAAARSGDRHRPVEVRTSDRETRPACPSPICGELSGAATSGKDATCRGSC
jgi:hypothetical protein